MLALSSVFKVGEIMSLVTTACWAWFQIQQWLFAIVFNVNSVYL